MKSLRIILKILLIIFLVFASLFLLLSIVLSMKSVRSAIKDKVLQQIQERSGLAVTIDTIEGWLPFEGQITGLKVSSSKNEDPFLLIDTLSFSWDPVALLQHTVHLPTVHVNRAFFATETSSLSGMQATQDLSSRMRSLPLGLHVGNIQIKQLLLSPHSGGNGTAYRVQGKFGLYPWRIRYTTANFDIALLDSSSPAFNIAIKGAGKNLIVKAATDLSANLPKDIESLSLSAHIKAPLKTWTAFLQQALDATLRGKVELEAKASASASASSKALLAQKLIGNGTFELFSDRSARIDQMRLHSQYATFLLQANVAKELSSLEGTLTGTISEIKPFLKGYAFSVEGPLSFDSTFSLSGSSLQGKATVNSDHLLLQKMHAKATSAAWEGTVSLTTPFHTLGHLEISSELEGLAFSARSDMEIMPRLVKLTHLSLKHGDEAIVGDLNVHLAESASEKPLLDGELSGTLSDLSLLSNFLPPEDAVEGGATFQLRFYAPPNRQGQSVQGKATLKSFSFKQFNLRLGNAIFAIDDIFTKPQGTLSFGGKDFKDPLIGFAEMEGEINFGPDEWQFAFLGKGDYRGPLDIDFQGRWNENAHILRILEGKGATKEIPFQLLKPIDITFDQKRLAISPLLLAVSDGHLQLEMDASDEKSSLDLQVQQLPLEILSLVFPQSLFAGIISGNMHLSNHSGEGHFMLQSTLLPMRHLPSSISLDGYIDLNFSKNTIALQSELKGLGLQPLHIDASLPFRLSLYPFRFDIDKKQRLSGAVSWNGQLEEIINLLLLDSSPFKGEVEVDLKANGTWNSPNMRGELKLYDGSYESVLTGASLKNISARAIAEGKQIILENLTATDGENGAISAIGHLSLNEKDHFPYSVTVNLKDAALLHLDPARASFNGEVTYAGNTQGANLAGKIIVEEAHLSIPKKIRKGVPTVEVTYKHPLADQALPAPTHTFFPLTLDLDVDVPRKTFLTGRGLNAEWKGDLKVTGQPAAPLVKGTLQLVKGDVALFGRTFTLTQGTITFGGRPDKDTFIYVVAQFEVTGYTMKAVLQGPLSAPEINFQSNPPLPPTEILSRILFGSSVSQISPLQGIQLAHALINLSGTFSGPDFLTNIQQGLGLDELTIVNAESSITGSTLPVLHAGKYISEGVLLSIDKTLSGDENNVGFEARLSDDFRIRVEVSESEDNTLLLEWKHDY